MSRILRRQLFSIAELLEKANKILGKKLFGSGMDEQAIIELVTDCQDSAISMGEQIEKMYGEGTASVGILEQYCENLYLLTISLQDAIKRRELYNTLNKQLKKLRGVMNNELPDKLEVVFLPYKASMWDSLESVYLAAKEDENCDAYCVPIPYFDRNADGSLGQMHYEGNEYPANIEITDWQAYNLEERRPDVIYIHNPYDEWNLVTCVYPRYFSSNLKKYTDELVYIPYFVLSEIEPDDQKTIDGIKHFIWTPGVIYADKVILQSEKMKQIYINEFIKAAREKGLCGDYLNRRNLEKKFIGSGSPKFDKVQNTRKEDLEIPEEWMQIIRKSDGTWKKIVFYNTSISALLENNENMLIKIEDVFRVFYEKRNEVALLWRPHPLIESTLTSIRPNLWREYKRICEEYVQGGWGIYDNTPNVERAVVLSDAYYGDRSSVVQLYQKTNKRIMIQQVQYSYKQKYQKVWVQDAICSKEDILFIIAEVPGIFLLNTSSGKIEFHKVCADIKGLCCFMSMELVEDKVVLIPYQTDEIITIALDKWKIYKTKLPHRYLKESGKNYMASISIDSMVYMFGAEQPYVIKYNAESNEILEVIDLLKEKKVRELDKGEVYFKRQVIYRAGYIYAPFSNMQAILKLHITSMNYEVIELGREKDGYSGGCLIGEEMWLPAMKKSQITIWNEREQNTRYIQGKKNGNKCAGVSYLENKCAIFPEQIECSSDYSDLSMVEEQYGSYEFVKERANYTIYYDNFEGVIGVTNNTGNTKKFHISVSRDMICENSKENEFVGKEKFTLEVFMYDLRDLMELI